MPKLAHLLAIPAALASLIATQGCGSSASTPESQAAPLVIAHRGASGLFPEHTRAAYTHAHEVRADMIEPDLVLTRDGVLVCSHDITLERTTDVDRVFPDRARADGSWYIADFTLDELRRLDKYGPPGRQQPGHRFVTFEEMLDLVEDLNRESGHTADVIPELKKPEHHRAEGLPLIPPFVEMIRARGLDRADSGLVVQCFELRTLRSLHNEHRLRVPLVWLIHRDPDLDAIAEASSFLAGIGPNRRLLEDENGHSTELLHAARTLSLELYPYTFQDNDSVIHRFLKRHRVNGVFTDFPGNAVRIRDQLGD